MTPDSTTPHRRTAAPRQVPAPASTPAPIRGRAPRRPGRPVPRRRGLVALVGVSAVAVATLCGCGIRDTALPVDAGVAASRTACPPAPDATLSKLAKDASILPTRAAPALPPEAEASADEARLAQLEKKLEQEKRRSAAVSATPSAVPAAPSTATAAPSPAPGATASDGTLSCLLSPSP